MPAVASEQHRCCESWPPMCLVTTSTPRAVLQHYCTLGDATRLHFNHFVTCCFDNAPHMLCPLPWCPRAPVRFIVATPGTTPGTLFSVAKVLYSTCAVSVRPPTPVTAVAFGFVIPAGKTPEIISGEPGFNPAGSTTISALHCSACMCCPTNNFCTCVPKMHS
jgi:hypothetical protein